MVIGIDGNEANIENRVGVNKYAFEIIKGMHDFLPKNPDLIVYVYLKNDPLPDMPKETGNFKYKILRGGKVWIITKLMPHLLLTKDKPDVFFTPSHYLPPILTMPGVMAIMDLGYLEFSAQFKKYDYWQLKYWTAWSIKISKCIITISDASKKDIVRHYPASKDRIHVTYPGYDEHLMTHKISPSQRKAVMAKYSIVNDYILYLGTLKPSKNVERLIDAWGKIVNQFPEISLVIGGKKGWLYESIFKRVSDNRLQGRVIFTDFVAEEDKATIIAGAKVFVIPSFWEGFGLDVLTAFALSTPVVYSNVGSLPEVAGNAGIAVNPYDTDNIANGIKKVLNLNKKEYNEVVSEGRKQLSNFSWEKSTKRTVEVLKEAIK